MDRLTNLKILELGSNRISELQGLSSLHNLEELWLGRNKISSLDSLGRCILLSGGLQHYLRSFVAFRVTETGKKPAPFSKIRQDQVNVAHLIKLMI